MDMSSAFDIVWHRGIISKLRIFDISENLLGIVKSYRRGRSLFVVGNGHSFIERHIRASVPQRSYFGKPSLMTSFKIRAMWMAITMPITRKQCLVLFTSFRVLWRESGDAGSLASEKTQAMLMSRRRDQSSLSNLNILLDGENCHCRTSSKSSG